MPRCVEFSDLKNRGDDNALKVCIKKITFSRGSETINICERWISMPLIPLYARVETSALSSPEILTIRVITYFKIQQNPRLHKIATPISGLSNAEIWRKENIDSPYAIRYVIQFSSYLQDIHTLYRRVITQLSYYSGNKICSARCAKNKNLNKSIPIKFYGELPIKSCI